MPRKACPVCSHVERDTIDKALTILRVSPRSIVRRYVGLSRKAVQGPRRGTCPGAGGGGERT
jgi:hypothetical protein